MLELPVHNFDLEMSNSDLDMLELMRKHPFTKDITFGVVDVHSHLIEDVETIKARIRKALEYIPRDAIWIDPDCGLKTRTVEEAKAKLSNVQDAVKAVRAGL
jgi:5-methyltetrahydropteroyltriglutamate--homocysteine methyltransferase